ncbi:MAG: holo-ACP synthase [Epsilonproteobacteria bacterium]|nr:holo-ACP synthase [Campylobacterota bacterium]NPA64037.1 holo-ACP synthase [Campylobacterota bacterium]
MIGIDIVSIDRIEKLHKRFGTKGLERFLLPSELQEVNRIESIAGYWAAKEAIAKALKCGIGKKLGFKDIEIYKEPSGAPNFRLLNHKEELFLIQDRSLSITHDGGFAIAAAIILRR